MNNFSKIFEPKSVAVVGASDKKGGVGNDILKNLVLGGFSGDIYPVNPKYSEVLGLKCYNNLKSVKNEIDLMIIAVPAKIVPNILKEGADLGISGAIIISSGFKEVGEISLEKEIKDICQKNNITLLGPNCLGIINPSLNLNASFAASSPLTGKIAFISQSGALCTAIIDSAKFLNLGFSKFISIGNKAITGETDLLNYLADDKDTEIIAIYTEQLCCSEDFLKACHRLSKKNKAVIILKGGVSDDGAGAIASHTGSLAGDDKLYRALFKQANVIVADSSSQLLNYLQIVNNNYLSYFNKLAILSNAGGPGVLAVDALNDFNLSLASFEASSGEKLSISLPLNASLGNPIDILGDALADRYSLVLKVLANDKKVDSVLIIFTPQSMSEAMKTAEEIVSFKNKSKKALAVVFMGEDLIEEARGYLRKNNVATFSFPEEAAESLSIFSDWLRGKIEFNLSIKKFDNTNKKLVRNIINQSKDKQEKFIREDRAFEVLSAYGLPIVKNYFTSNFQEVLEKSKLFKNNLVLKISSPDILHKSDLGGVKLNIDKKEIKSAYFNLLKEVKKNKKEADISGVLLAEMISENRTEMIIGAVRDPILGPAVMVGFGGIYVEIIKDQAFGVYPLSFKKAEDMVDSLKMSKILEGVRSKTIFDKKSLIDCLLRLMQLMYDFPEIKEVDINPLLVLKKGRGVKAVDARIILN